ncbi:DUF3270 family protein [Pseudolactococcus reticulitermitis]|uniref:DUF3270 family protein n=1 Tax=Pseudolactococcus reticulitermitis TaxID=2025039 RepID=A0A224X0W9_9LACT|nr:DUF3270 family protein [Lactococcus reticulitermitis]GAX47858.1 hypothetical protein RsY01_1462 [Lactococcus reticulitermitis]GHU38023.1 hypothetical protein FACS1894192_08510 [Bacilli bacterium]
MEAPKYDEDLNYWQAPTRDYYREEKASEDKMIAERFNEIAFFFNIAVFSVLMILSCTILSAFMPSVLNVLLSIALSFTMLQVSRQAIKTFLRIIKK